MKDNQELLEIKADVNYFVGSLIEKIYTLQAENDYLERQIRILKGECEDEAEQLIP